MYLVYCSTTGMIFRDVECYRDTPEQLEAGFNEQYTLIYPHSLNPAVLEVSNEYLESLGDYDKYLIIDGSIVENPEWVDPEADKKKLAELEAQVTDLQLSLVELYEASLGGV